jgi:glycosyltransferase involved in cell wall biosynthesis
MLTRWALGVVASESIDQRLARGKVTFPDVTVQALRLWSGQSAVAKHRLEAILTNELVPQAVRGNAAISLAVFHASQDDLQGTRKLLGYSSGMELTARDTKRWKLMNATMLRLDGELNELRQFTNGWEQQHADPDLFWMSLNTTRVSDAPGAVSAPWMKVVNEFYASHGVSPISLRSPAKGIRLDNFAPAKEHVTESGKKGQPLISIIIPAYNGQGRIESAIRGLQEQTWQNIEIIVVDDCSSDDTVNVVKKICAEDSRVRLFEQRKNAGCYLARNRGLEESKGEFVTTHDIDDWSHPEKLEKQVAPLINDNTSVASISHALRCSEDMLIQEKQRALTVSVMLENSSSLLFRRKIIDRLGPWDKVRTGGDSEFIKRIRLVYGSDSIIPVLPLVPLSFVLGGHDSLTNAGATHISSLYFGVRREYNSRYSIWHGWYKSGKLDNLPDFIEEKGDWSVPDLIKPAKRHEVELDLLVLLDGVRDEKAIRELLAVPRIKGISRIGFLHWPGPRTQPTRDFDSRLRIEMVEGRLEPIYLGQKVTASKAIILSEDCFWCVPDRFPILKADKVFLPQVNNKRYDRNAWINAVFYDHSSIKVGGVDDL